MSTRISLAFFIGVVCLAPMLARVAFGDRAARLTSGATRAEDENPPSKFEQTFAPASARSNAGEDPRRPPLGGAVTFWVR